MSIMQRLQSAESTFNEALSVADEIVTVGEDLLAKLTAHRDDLKAAAGTMLERLGSVATAIRAEVVSEPDATKPGDGSKPVDFDALRQQVAQQPC